MKMSAKRRKPLILWNLGKGIFPEYYFPAIPNRIDRKGGGLYKTPLLTTIFEILPERKR